MTRFATFAALYMAAVLLELGEHRRPAGKNRLPVPAPSSGARLPVVEFRKLIYAWTRAGATIPLTFNTGGGCTRRLTS